MNTRLPLAFGALLSALVLASCAGTPTDVQTSQPPAPQKTPTVSATPVADETSAPEPSAAATCETIISAGTVDALASQGWTFQEEELRVGETIVDGGLLCLWADFSTASDHGQMYGWGPLSTEAANDAKSGLQRDGWLRSVEGDTTYFTEDPAYAIATDEDGFGMTYQFGEGWVKFADTKQGLLLIEWNE